MCCGLIPTRVELQKEYELWQANSAFEMNIELTRNGLFEGRSYHQRGSTVYYLMRMLADDTCYPAQVLGTKREQLPQCE